MEVKFIVLGNPVGKGRPKFTKTGHAFTPKDTVNYETLVHMEYLSQCGNAKFPDDAMLDMRIKAYYSIPKSKSKKQQNLMREGIVRPIKKPDMNNCIKIIADALNKIAYRDDTQIVDCQVRKFYSDNPRVEVRILDIKKQVNN